MTVSGSAAKSRFAAFLIVALSKRGSASRSWGLCTSSEIVAAQQISLHHNIVPPGIHSLCCASQMVAKH